MPVFNNFIDSLKADVLNAYWQENHYNSFELIEPKNAGTDACEKVKLKGLENFQFLAIHLDGVMVEGLKNRLGFFKREATLPDYLLVLEDAENICFIVCELKSKKVGKGGFIQIDAGYFWAKFLHLVQVSGNDLPDRKPHFHAILFSQRDRANNYSKYYEGTITGGKAPDFPTETRKKLNYQILEWECDGHPLNLGDFCRFLKTL